MKMPASEELTIHEMVSELSEVIQNLVTIRNVHPTMHGLVHRLQGVRAGISRMLLEMEAENDRLMRAKVEREAQKEQTKKKTAETRAKVKAQDIRLRQLASSLSLPARVSLIKNHLVPALESTPRIIRLERNDTGLIWGHASSDSSMTEEDLAIIMAVADIHGLMERQLGKSQYVECVDGIRDFMVVYS